MEILGNGKRRTYYFVEFVSIHLKIYSMGKNLVIAALVEEI